MWVFCTFLLSVLVFHQIKAVVVADVGYQMVVTGRQAGKQVTKTLQKKLVHCFCLGEIEI